MNTQERYRFYATIYLELKKKTEDVVADERVELDSLGNILKLSSLSKELGSLQERRNRNIGLMPIYYSIFFQIMESLRLSKIFSWSF